MRTPVKGPRRPPSKTRSLAPPVRGLVLNEPLTNAKPGGAVVLDNFFPTSTGIRTRGGTLKYATIGTDPVLRMWAYRSGAITEFFASDEENIFNITTVVDADTPPSADVTGQTSGYYSVAQFGTAGGDYLYAVNGSDEAQLYDGSTWTAINGSSSPAITGVTTSDLEFVWSFANRLFFIEADSMTVWYLPVDSLGGAAAAFSLAGVFQQGGRLVLGGTWSVDAGAGLDDLWVVVSSEGEVAVYSGTNPGDAAAWSKVGVYRIAPPMGANATTSAGGDFLIATEDGIIPISEAVKKDVAALSLAAITRPIEPMWKEEVPLRRTLPWEIVKWPEKNMMIVSLPSPDEGIPLRCLVANLETGAWCRYTGVDVRCLTIVGETVYFGASDGTIHQFERTGADDGVPYTCVYVGLPEHLSMPGAYKTVHSARAYFQSNAPFSAKISASANYKVSLPAPPSSTADFSLDVWDSALWDVGKWDAGTSITVFSKWVSIGKSGTVFSPQLQITCGTSIIPKTELIQFDFIYDTGGVMV